MYHACAYLSLYIFFNSVVHYFYLMASENYCKMKWLPSINKAFIIIIIIIIMGAAITPWWAPTTHMITMPTCVCKYGPVCGFEYCKYMKATQKFKLLQKL